MSAAGESPKRALRHGFVKSLDELARRPFADGRNAWCFPRTLAGDFVEVARALAPPDGVADVDDDTLRALPLSPAGRAAVRVLLEDLRQLRALHRDPVLNCITSYPRDTRGLPIATDVMSFHVDRAPVECDTWLCTYAGKSSELLDNDDAERILDRPGVRAALRRASGCEDDERFAAYVRQGSFDLHYAMRDGAAPVSLGTGNLWRIAVDWPGCAVPPCIHRAPDPRPDDAPRLLLLC